MPTVQETAYPRFRQNTRAKDLIEFYTPTREELSYAEGFIRTRDMKVGFFVLLKSFQRLGYFTPLTSVPEDIAKHIARSLGCKHSVRALREYDRSRNKWKHVHRIRQFMGTRPFGSEAMLFLGATMRQAALTKQDVVDIINIGIEELVRSRFELPAFDTLLREANKARSVTNREIYQRIYDKASEGARSVVDEILATDPETKRSPWNDLRQDPGKPTLKELNRLIDRLIWLRGINQFEDPFDKVPYAKVRHLSLEACSLDAARMRAVSKPKRFALAAALVKFRLAGAVDDLCEILIRKMGRIHANGRIALAEYLEENSERADEIIANYKDIYDLASAPESPEKQLGAIKSIFEDNPGLVEYARNHSVFGAKNYFRFLWPSFKGYRAALFRLLTELRLVSTSSDKSMKRRSLLFWLTKTQKRTRSLSNPDAAWTNPH